MLNELSDLAQSLRSLNVTMDSWHTNFRTCPKSTSTYYALIDPAGLVTDLDAIVDRERIGSIRKWEVAAGVSFPAFNVLPLFAPGDEATKQAILELRKLIMSKAAPKPSDLVQRLNSVIATSSSLWVKKEPVRITKCFTTLAYEMEKVLGQAPAPFQSITQLIIRARILTVEKLHSQLASVLIKKIVDAPNLAADLFDSLFFHSGNDAKKWSLIFEVSDRSSFEYPANHERVQAWMNSMFQTLNEQSDEATMSDMHPSSDAFGNPADRVDSSFPSVRLPVLGNVILRSMSSESPCQRRYGLADSKSYCVGQTTRQEMKTALEWIGHPDRRGKTWCDVSSLNGVSSALFAYPSQKLENAPELAGMIGGIETADDPDGAIFEACAARVTSSLTELSHEAPRADVRIFVLSKPDGFRTKILNSSRYSIDRLITKALEWKRQSKNIPRILIRQFGLHKGDKPFWGEPHAPYPADVVRCLNTAWERSGTHAEQVPGFGIGDGLAILLDEGVVLKTVASRSLRNLIANSLSLLLAVGHANQQGLVHPVGKTHAKQALLLPCILGLLLAKLARMKEEYMKTPPYLIGRLLSLADQLHLQYCKEIRKGQVPPQLVGNALMATALEQPKKAVAMFSKRILPYHAWAQTLQGGNEVRLTKYFLGEIGRLCIELNAIGLPLVAGDTEKAEMILGYLARPEKEKDAESNQLVS